MRSLILIALAAAALPAADAPITLTKAELVI